MRRDQLNDREISRFTLPAGSRGFAIAGLSTCFSAPTMQQPGATVDSFVQRWLDDIPGQ